MGGETKLLAAGALAGEARAAEHDQAAHDAAAQMMKEQARKKEQGKLEMKARLQDRATQLQAAAAGASKYGGRARRGSGSSSGSSGSSDISACEGDDDQRRKREDGQLEDEDGDDDERDEDMGRTGSTRPTAITRASAATSTVESMSSSGMCSLTTFASASGGSSSKDARPKTCTLMGPATRAMFIELFELLKQAGKDATPVVLLEKFKPLIRTLAFSTAPADFVGVRLEQRAFVPMVVEYILRDADVLEGGSYKVVRNIPLANQALDKLVGDAFKERSTMVNALNRAADPLLTLYADNVLMPWRFAIHESAPPSSSRTRRRPGPASCTRRPRVATRCSASRPRS